MSSYEGMQKKPPNGGFLSFLQHCPLILDDKSQSPQLGWWKQEVIGNLTKTRLTGQKPGAPTNCEKILCSYLLYPGTQTTL